MRDACFKALSLEFSSCRFGTGRIASAAGEQSAEPACGRKAHPEKNRMIRRAVPGQRKPRWGCPNTRRSRLRSHADDHRSSDPDPRRRNSTWRGACSTRSISRPKAGQPVDMASASPALCHLDMLSNYRYNLKMLKPTRHIVASAAFLVFLLTLAPHAWAQTSAGSISALNGTVTVERAGKSIPAAHGTALEVGDKLTTGPNSRVSVSLSDGSQMEINDSSTLVMTENVLNPDGSRASTKVTLLSGLVRSLVKFGPGSRPNFEVHTPTPSLPPAAPCLMFRTTRASHRLPRPDPDIRTPVGPTNLKGVGE